MPLQSYFDSELVSAFNKRIVRAALDSPGVATEIIGGYADSRGRVCPSVAAFRRGARSCVGTFPRAWDDFGQARRPRPATKRELEILRALLEECLTGPLAPICGPLSEPQPVLVETGA